MGLSAALELLIGEYKKKTYLHLTPAERTYIANALSFMAFEIHPTATVLPFKKPDTSKTGVLEDLKTKNTE